MFAKLQLTMQLKLIENTWDNMHEKAWLNDKDIAIQDKAMFLRELANYDDSRWGIEARIWEMFVAWIWSWRVDVVVDKIISSQALSLLDESMLVKWFDMFKNTTKKQPSLVWKKHYDIDFDLYKHMLWDTLKYTSWYWDESQYWAFDLEKSQKLCMDLICQRLQLQNNHSVLEIWFWYGTLANYMIENYNVSVTWLTVSQWQAHVAQQILEDHDNQQSAQLHIKDWKDIYASPEFEESYKWKFDRIVAVEMIEAVSTTDLPMFMKFLYECLDDGGVLVLQVINSPRLVETTDGYLDQYIFPDGVIPQKQNLIDSWIQAWFKGVKIDNTMWPSYDPTLMSWQKNLEDNYKKLQSLTDPFASDFPYSLEDPMLKIFEYYLKSCAGSFRADYNQTWHFVFHKDVGSSQSLVIPTRDEVVSILKNREWWDVAWAIA